MHFFSKETNCQTKPCCLRINGAAYRKLTILSPNSAAKAATISAKNPNFPIWKPGKHYFYKQFKTARLLQLRRATAGGPNVAFITIGNVSIQV